MARVVYTALFVFAFTVLVNAVQLSFSYNRLGSTIVNGKDRSDTTFLAPPQNWGDVAAACKNGKFQSPINFRQQDIVYRPDLEAITLKYGTIPEPVDTVGSALVDGGDACLFSYADRSSRKQDDSTKNPSDQARFTYRSGSNEGLVITVPPNLRSQFAMSGGPLPNPQYLLEDITFKMPSDHQSEGLSYAMEVQFKHSYTANKETQYAILGVLYYVGEQESAWLSQFTNVERPAEATYTSQRDLAFGPGNSVPINARGSRFTGLNTDNKAAINNIVCSEGRLCAIVDDSRAAVANVVGARLGPDRQFIFEFAPVSRIEARALLKGTVYEQIRRCSTGNINIYKNIEDAVLGETWRYSSRAAITFDNLLLGSEAPNDVRNIVPFRYYEGSLTNPPCTPNTFWVVTAVPQEMSVYQYGVFRRILGEKPNNRPIQPTSGRTVISSWYKDDKTYYDVQYDMNFDRLFQVKRT